MAPMRLAVPRPDATFDDWEKFILHLFDQGWICNENLCVWKAPVEFVHVIAGKEVHYPVSGARFNFQLPRLIRNQFRGHKSSTLHFAGDFPRGVTTLDATAIHLPGPLDTDNQQALLATSTETDNASSQESAPPTTAVADQQAPLSKSHPMRHAVYAVELLNSLTYFSYASSLERGLADDVSHRLQRALTDSGWFDDTNGGLWAAASNNAVRTRQNLLLAQRLDKLQTQSESLLDKAKKLRRAITKCILDRTILEEDSKEWGDKLDDAQADVDSLTSDIQSQLNQMAKHWRKPIPEIDPPDY